MEERTVVTVFLRNGGAVLLLRRSDEVGSYAGRWGGVAGHAEGEPDRAAIAEVEEETGIEERDLTRVRRGDPFVVEDEDLGVEWTVQPYLFDTETRAVETDWETAAAEWVHPTEILARDTVPDLWTSYDRVRPRVDTVESDTVHGSAYISVRALEVLRDEAAVLADSDAGWEAVAAVGTALRNARPEMAAVTNRVNHAMYEAEKTRTPAAAHQAARERIEAAVEADSEAASRAASKTADREVFTLSRSSTVREALLTGEPRNIRVAVSRPGGEGEQVANALAEEELDVTLTSDANIPGAVRDSGVVLVGADSVLADGDLVNKVGTTAAMLAGNHFGTENIAVCAAAKIRPDTEVTLSKEESGELSADESVQVSDPVFERTPGSLVDAIVTERGELARDDVESIAATYAEYASWAEE